MAIFRPGAIVGGVSGAVGGAEFLSGRGGAIIRKRQAKRSQKTLAMTNQQAVYQRAVGAWRALSDDNRTLWIQLAKQITTANRLGLHRNLTGFQSFMRSAIPSIHVRGTTPNFPAENVNSPQPTGYSFISTDAADIEYQLQGVSPFAVQGVQVFAGFAINHPDWTQPRLWRMVFAGQLSIGASVELIPTWPSDFALPETGWKLFLRTRVVQIRAFPSATANTDLIVT